MIIDITGIELIPGKQSKYFPGNKGDICCCDECDYLLCCTTKHNIIRCIACESEECPRAGIAKGYNKKIIKIAEIITEKFNLFS